MELDLNELSLLAILAGGILYMVYGGIYYSIMLGKKKDAQFTQSEGPLKYIVSVIIAFIGSFIMAVLTEATGAHTLLEGLMIGAMIGVVISLVYLKNSLFKLMTRKAFFIAIGDHLVIFTLLGGLHGILS
ncbi:hypothetical protein JOC95_000618 [Bacillus tianshenii]|uniref:DUF1761 domain-containing protein n=1 Tax=Sutcliffiella tianshenii TaxID=1463404 RepID=A0ABS2NVT0_9BACI|nr:DUF1761 domain-containing protein [Bacillus tianshenii]MBM7618776.1 hypothetical protein [Bacillus tianshenii]